MSDSRSPSQLRWSFAICVSLGCGSVGASAVAVKQVQVADGVYQFITAPDGYVPNGNSVVVVSQSDVLVFDTFTRPSTARNELAAIRRITDKPVRFVVNSHWHPDHWSGNEIYARTFPNLEIIATEETRQLMLNTANAWPGSFAQDLRKDQAALDLEIRTGKQSDGTALSTAKRRSDVEDMRLEREFIEEAMQVVRTYPTLTYTDQLVIRHGGREFRFISVVGDARGTTVLYLPKEKILITGDVLSYPIPYFTPPLSQHARTLRQLASFDATTIIPGHGPAWHDKDYLNLEADLFETIVSQVGAALRGGAVTVEEARKAVNVVSLRARFTHDDPDLNKQFDSYLQGMIENAYREARDGQVFTY